MVSAFQSRKPKYNTDKGVPSKNAGSNPAPHERGGSPRAISKLPRDISSKKKEKEDQPPAQHLRRNTYDSKRWFS